VTFVLAQIMFLSKMHVCRAFFITDRMLRIWCMSISKKS
jgi:hypothetical protein